MHNHKFNLLFFFYFFECFFIANLKDNIHDDEIQSVEINIDKNSNYNIVKHIGN